MEHFTTDFNFRKKVGGWRVCGNVFGGGLGAKKN